MEEHSTTIADFLFNGLLAWLWFMAGRGWEMRRRTREDQNGG